MINEFKENFTPFTDEMKNTHTILVPMMLPIHFALGEKLLNTSGYKFEFLKTDSRKITDEGLKHVHNDACYPALLVIGQMIDALKSGKYDLDKTAVLITQTGGGCRASNYLSLLRKALKQAGFENIPALSINFSGLEKEHSVSFDIKLLYKAVYLILYGDLLMSLNNQCRAHETVKGDTSRLINYWTAKLGELIADGKASNLDYAIPILDDFSKINRTDEKKIKVGIVGEIYMKYAPLGNNNLEQFLISEGAEPVVSGVLDFLLYCFTNSLVDEKIYGKKSIKNIGIKVGIKYLINLQKKFSDIIKQHGVFTPSSNFEHLTHCADGFISHGVKMGEGWLLTAEMAELIESGVDNIVCTQPFGCLPNHIIAKGMIRKIKEVYPLANIVPVDYDPSATKINQENRLKLMLANASLNYKKQHEIQDDNILASIK